MTVPAATTTDAPTTAWFVRRITPRTAPHEPETRNEAISRVTSGGRPRTAGTTSSRANAFANANAP